MVAQIVRGSECQEVGSENGEGGSESGQGGSKVMKATRFSRLLPPLSTYNSVSSAHGDRWLWTPHHPVQNGVFF